MISLLRTRSRHRAAQASNAAFLAVLALVLSTLIPISAGAQQTDAGLERGIAAIEPDSIRVGEEFDLELTAISDQRLQFPALLSLAPEFEQTGPPRVESEGEVWRAVYPLVAWRSGRLQLPEVEVPVTGGREERSLLIRPPMIEVISVLPPASEQPRLWPPRSPDDGRGFPWEWLIALLLAALLARELLRRRRPAPTVAPPTLEEPSDPLDEALAAVLRLRTRLDAGHLPPAELYDEVEAILRHYLVRTRGWPEEAPVRSALRAVPRTAGASTPEDPAVPAGEDVLRQPDLQRLDPVVRRALPARFGALEVSADTLRADLEAVIAWFEARAAA